MVKGQIEFEWRDEARQKRAVGIVRCSDLAELQWELSADGVSPSHREIAVTTHHRQSIRAQLRRWQKRFSVADPFVTGVTVAADPATLKPVRRAVAPFGRQLPPWRWMEDNIQLMAEAERLRFSPLGRMLEALDPAARAALAREERRLLRQEERRAYDVQRRHEAREHSRKTAAPGTACPGEIQCRHGAIA